MAHYWYDVAERYERALKLIVDTRDSYDDSEALWNDVVYIAEQALLEEKN